jgi:hypothetical protein
MNKQKVGLWLAEVALRLTGNRRLAAIVPALPTIRERRLLISESPADKMERPQELKGTWAYWMPAEKSAQSS